MRSRLAEGGALAMRLSLFFQHCTSRRSLLVAVAATVDVSPIIATRTCRPAQIAGLTRAQALTRKSQRHVPSIDTPENPRDADGARSALLDLVERFTRVTECVDAGGNTAIDGDLKQDLLDLFLGEAVLQRALDVQLQLVGPVERAEHGEVDDAARAAIEARSRPQRAPAELGRPLRHRARELVGAGDRLVDVVLAQHLLADLQAFFEQRAPAHFRRLLFWRFRKNPTSPGRELST